MLCAILSLLFTLPYAFVFVIYFAFVISFVRVSSLTRYRLLALSLSLVCSLSRVEDDLRGRGLLGVLEGESIYVIKRVRVMPSGRN